MIALHTIQKFTHISFYELLIIVSEENLQNQIYEPPEHMTPINIHMLMNIPMCLSNPTFNKKESWILYHHKPQLSSNINCKDDFYDCWTIDFFSVKQQAALFWVKWNYLCTMLYRVYQMKINS